MTRTNRLTCCQQGLQSCVIAMAIACFKVEVCRGPSGIGACLLYCLYFSRRGTLRHKVHVHMTNIAGQLWPYSLMI